MSEHEISASEVESDSEPECPPQETVSFSQMFNRVLNSRPPLSKTHPGYLLGLVNLASENVLPEKLETFLRGLERAAKLWNNNIGRASRKGVLEYILSCQRS